MSHPRSGYAPSRYGTAPGFVPAAPPPPPPPERSRTGWWIALIVGLCLLGLLSGALVAALSRTSAPTAPAAPASVAPRTPQGPSAGSDQSAGPEDGFPRGSTACSASHPGQGDFTRSASGNEQTSCDFAEAVRLAYLGQPRRNEVVTVHATSPVTGRDYLMTCSGDRPVTCLGGDAALVYLG